MAFEVKKFQNKKWDDLTDDERRLDFELKSEQLYYYGEEISSATFYQDFLFKDIDILPEGEFKILLTNYDAEKGHKVNKISIDEIHEYLSFSNVALSPCLFQKNWRNKKLLEYVCAFVLDIDKVRPYDLPDFFRVFDDGLIPLPTFIANSGSGVHFYYILDKMFNINPIKNKQQFNLSEMIYNKLYDFVHKTGWYDAQRHWIGQDYRVVNSKTKFGQTSAIFKTGDVYTIEKLAEICSISIEEANGKESSTQYTTNKMINWAIDISKSLEIDLPNLEDQTATYNFIKENKIQYEKFKIEKQNEYFKDTTNHLKTIKPKPVKFQKNKEKKDTTDEGKFYEYTLNKIVERTQPGKRYNACKALAVIAYKEQISEEKFLNDLNALINYWDSRFTKDKFNSNNIEALKRLYKNGEKYIKTTSKTLEKWLDFSFERKGKESSKSKKKTEEKLTPEQYLHLGRSQRDLRCMFRGKKDWREGNGRKKGTVETSYVGNKIKKYLELHPNAKIKEIMEETGATYPTVRKWYDIIKNNSDTNPAPQQIQIEFEKVRDSNSETRGRTKGSTKDVTTSSKAQVIKEYLIANPGASKNRVTRETGFDHKTVAKWYDQVKKLIESENTDDKQMTIYDYIEE